MKIAGPSLSLARPLPRTTFFRLPCLAALALMAIPRAEARIPPSPVPMDKILAEAPTIVVGKVLPGSRMREAGDYYPEVKLHVTRVIKGTTPGKEITVVLGSFPAKEFPPTKEHPTGRYLLTGWGAFGHTSEEPKGLDLYTDQVWLLERFPDHPRLRAPKAPLGVAHFESVQPRMYAPLFDVLANKAPMNQLRLMITKGFGGQTPAFVIEALCGSTDPDAGRFVWDCLKEIEDYEQTTSRLARLLDQDKGRGPKLREYTAFRTLYSLGRDEALRWCRKALTSSSDTIRHYGIEGLLHYDDVESVPVLLNMLEETTERARRLRAFARFADSHIAEGLNAQAEQAENKTGLIRALGHLGDARALPALLDCLEADASPWQTTQEALFRLTGLRLSPNGKLARAWYVRNKDRPRWHWLKQSIEQDLLLLAGKPTTDWTDDFHPATHLERLTCWSQGRGEDQVAAWQKWWRANRDLSQEQWVLDSFRAVGHPLPPLDSPEAVDALIDVFSVKPGHWGDKGPVLDTYLHPVWCDRLLQRLTGLTVVESNYAFFYERFYLDGKVHGPKWRDLWEANRKSVKLRPIAVPPPQEFRLDEEDRRLIAQELEALRCEVVREGPLVDKGGVKGAEKDLLATFVLSVTNTTDRPLTLTTKPAFEGTNKTVRWTTHLHTEDFVCLAKADWVTLAPGEALRWRTRQHVRFAEPKDASSYQFRLRFHQRGPSGDAWRGVAHMPWIAVPADAEVAKEGGGD